MKILLVNHGTAGDWVGGDSVQIKETAKRLRQRGHLVETVNSDNPNTIDFDIVHIFNCRIPSSFEKQIISCRKTNTPVVVSPIWVSLKRAFWGSRGTFSVLLDIIKNERSNQPDLIEKLGERRIVVTTEKTQLHADGHGDLDNELFREMANLLQEVDGLIPNSWLELQAVRTDLNWTGNCFEIAHYGVDPKLFLDADPELFRKTTGIDYPFVLQAGRIEAAKNQAMLCWALRETNLPIVLIGSSKHWPEYAELCKSIYGNKLKIIPHLPQNILASAYAAASVHVLPSWMETCGLVSLEAALSGTPIVGSTFGHELEYLKGDAWYGDPANPKSIEQAVKEAWNAGKGSIKPTNMKRRILEEFNWEQTVDSTERLYQRVLKSRNKSTNGNV